MQGGHWLLCSHRPGLRGVRGAHRVALASLGRERAIGIFTTPCARIRTVRLDRRQSTQGKSGQHFADPSQSSLVSSYRSPGDTSGLLGEFLASGSSSSDEGPARFREDCTAASGTEISNMNLHPGYRLPWQAFPKLQAPSAHFMPAQSNPGHRLRCTIPGAASPC